MEYTRYERARIIGARSLQIALGAPVLVKVPKSQQGDVTEIARLEFDSGATPITVVRPAPAGGANA